MEIDFRQMITSNFSGKAEENASVCLYSSDVIKNGVFSSKVYMGLYGNEDIFVKKLPLLSQENSVVERDIATLVNVSKNCNLLKYFGGKFCNYQVFIAMEICDTNLERCTQENSFPIPQFDIIKQSACGLQYLHENDVLHGNLKPSNILISTSRLVKLSDFGMINIYSELYKAFIKSGQHVGIVDWLAPEVLRSYELDGSESKQTKESDMFSLGCIFYFTLTGGLHPFGDIFERPYNMVQNKPCIDDSAIEPLYQQALVPISELISDNTLQRFSAEKLIENPIFWTRQKTLSFLKNVQLYISRNVVAMEISIYLSKLLKDSDLSFWTSKVATELLGYCNIQGQVYKDNIHDLTRFVMYYYENFSNMPKILTEIVGSEPDSIIAHIQAMHPYLLPVLWTVFPENVSVYTEEKEGSTPVIDPKEVRFASFLEERYPTLRNFSKFAISKLEGSTAEKITSTIAKLVIASNMRKETETRLLSPERESNNAERVKSVKTSGSKNHQTKKELSVIGENVNNVLELAILNESSKQDPQQYNKQAKELEQFDNGRETALHHAVRTGNIKDIKHLFEVGLVDVHLSDKDGQTPIHNIQFTKRNFKETLDILLKYGADINAENKQGNTPLALATLKGKMKLELMYMVTRGADFTRKNASKQTLLHMSVFSGNLEGTHYFLALGVDVHSKDNDGRTPLHCIQFTEQNFKEIIETLLRHGADINATTKYGDTPLGLAAYGGKSEEELMYMISIGADWKMKNFNRQTVLHLAAQGGNHEAFQYFVELGLAIYTKDKYGHTPLQSFQLTEEHIRQTVSYLSKRGANTSAKDKKPLVMERKSKPGHRYIFNTDLELLAG